MRRTFWILLTPTILLIALGLAIDFFVFPRAATWGLNYVDRELQKKNLTLAVGGSELSLHRLSVFLKKVELSGALPGVPEPIRVEQVQIRLDPLSLLLGQLRISVLALDGLRLKIDLDGFPEDHSGPEPLPISEIFKWVEQIPLDRIALKRAELSIGSRKLDLEIEAQPIDAILSSHAQRLALRLYAPSVLAKSTRFPEASTVSLEALVFLERQKLILQSGQLMALGQTLLISGELDEPARMFIQPRGQAQINLSSDLKALSEKLNNFFKSPLPEMNGTIKVESELRFRGRDNFRGHATVDTKEIKIGNFEVGGLETKAILQGQVLSLDEIKVHHPSGEAVLKKSTLDLKTPYAFKTDADVTHLDLHRLLQALNLDQVPVWLRAEGHLPCTGQIQNFEINCAGDVGVHNLLVVTGRPPTQKVLVEIPEGHVSGQLTANLEKVKLKTQVQIGDGEGPVEGEVGYRTGFDFKFKTDDLDFHNIKQLVGLDFKGDTKIEGFTRGDSESAILNLHAQIQDFEFEKYALGDLGGNLVYEKGHLLLSDLSGTMPNSIYHGHLDVNLREDSLSGAVDFPKTDLKDITKIFDNIYAFPLSVRGDGQAHMQFSGPFNFWKMSYNLTSQFKNGQIQTEGFSSLLFNVKSEEGLIKVQQAELRKSGGLLKLSGQIAADQKAALQFEGNNWRLEESELVNRIKSNLLGALNLNGDLSGPIFHPDLRLKGHLAEMMIDEQELPSSFFEFHLNREFMEGSANLFGNKIQGDFKVPFRSAGVPSVHPLKIRAKTADWNFSSVLAVLGASQLGDEYESQLTSDIDLTSEAGDWTALTGRAEIKNLFLKRGSTSLKNPEPIDMQFNKGVITLKKFRLLGPNADFLVQGDGFTVNRMDIGVQAHSDLRLMHLMLPFLEDLGGPFQLEATISGSYQHPEVLGNARIDNTFVKLKGFPHPAEKLKAEIIFSHTKIVIQNIKGFLAGGTLSGDGSVVINGLNDLPTQIRLRAENLNMTVPEKVKTQGNANLIFSGNWFPFVLGGTYQVNSAYIESEFDDSGGASQVKDSIYLPKVLKEAAFVPVLLDLTVNLQRNVVIKNSKIDGLVTGQLQVKGPPARPVILGKVTLDKSSKLIFKDKLFELQTGSVTFTNPDETNAELYVTAQSRVDEYDISLLVQGPVKNPLIRLSSVPPLAEPEIISLLALGVTSEKLDQSVQSKDQANQVGYEAGAVLLSQSGLDKSLQTKLGVNVQITSSFDTTKNTNVPKITFKKKLTRRWSTTFSQGVGSDQSTKEVKVEYQINNNLSAVGSWAGRESQEGTSVGTTTAQSPSVFGLDLEFKREFK